MSDRTQLELNSRLRLTGLWFVLLLLTSSLETVAGPLLPPSQVGSLLEMTNGNVRLEYDLSTGRANFYWQNALRITGFYAGVGLNTYITGTIYTNRTWTVTNNTVEITLTGPALPTMKQTFIMDQNDSFLTRVDVLGSGLQSRWMGPVVMDTPGGVDIGSYGDEQALIVPFDNDSFTFSYNAMPINNTSMSYEVSAFYDNSTRQGLVVGSVTHDTWKTGVYFQGATNKLKVLNVFGGETSSDTRDVMPHGLVTGNIISSPTVFVGFGTDWRTVMEAFGAANTATVPRLTWGGGAPFGWNSWYTYTNSVSYSKASAASSFFKSNLQTNHFNNGGVVYINLDSYWDNLSDTQLQQFADNCHSNGQKAGIYWTPFVYWGTASQGTTNLLTGSSTYYWSDAYLRTTNGNVQSIDGGIALDPTHPGYKQLAAHYFGYFKGKGFDYLKLDFLSHGALEGVHYDTNVMTGIQAYNQGMQYLLDQNGGRMFLSESISPIFPYQYAHSRRICCDASTTISDTERTLQGTSYGWWLNGQLYQYNDPDVMKFAGGTTNENQSRLICCAISGTVFLNSDDLASSAGQNLAQTCLTNRAIDEVARAGTSFLPVEGNTGTSPSDVFVRQAGGNWYAAVFNYAATNVTKTLNLSRMGISASYTAVDLWSGAVSSVGGTSWTINLGANQAKLFELGSGSTSVSGPVSQPLLPGSSVTLSAVASGTPPFSYDWRKNGSVLPGRDENEITLAPESLSDAGVYSVEVSGGNGSATNSAVLTLQNPTNITAQVNGGSLMLNWPPGYTGWTLESQTGMLKAGVGANWPRVPGSTFTNTYVLPLNMAASNSFFRLAYITNNL